MFCMCMIVEKIIVGMFVGVVVSLFSHWLSKKK